MVAEALTQEEIDALLSGSPLPEAPAAAAGGGPSEITAEEEDTVMKYAFHVAGSMQNVLSTMMGETVETSIAGLSEVDADNADSAIGGDIVATTFGYKGMISGATVMALETKDALKLANQMMGGAGEGEFGDLEESALSETLSQVLNGANTELAAEMGGELQLDIPDVVTNPSSKSSILPLSDRKQVMVEYSIQSGPITGTFRQVIPRNLVDALANASVPNATPQDMPREYGGATGAAPILAQPAAFEPLLAAGPQADVTNLDLILDISLDIRVELGRSHKKIREVLELGPGSVVELDKLCGEPVDVLVNNKLFARGEVVVIDENFGVRITDILSIAERIEALK